MGHFFSVLPTGKAKRNHCICPHNHLKEEAFTIYNIQILQLSSLNACDGLGSIRDMKLEWLWILALPTF